MTAGTRWPAAEWARAAALRLVVVHVRHTRSSQRRASESSVIAVQLSRQHVIDLLRQAGLTEMAEAALHDLPDQVDRGDVAVWGGKWNMDMDYLIDRMGGSP